MPPLSTTTQEAVVSRRTDPAPRGWRYEIDEGELVIMSPAGRRHGRTVVRMARVLDAYAEAHSPAEVDGGEFGIYLRREPPQILRGADVAFYGSERLKQLGDEEGFAEVPPDLAVEVHLPDEEDMQRKVDQYLAAGVRSVWVVGPRRWTLTQHHTGLAPQTVAALDALVEDPVLPGFACHPRDLLGEPPSRK